MKNIKNALIVAVLLVFSGSILAADANVCAASRANDGFLHDIANENMS